MPCLHALLLRENENHKNAFLIRDNWERILRDADVEDFGGFMI